MEVIARVGGAELWALLMWYVAAAAAQRRGLPLGAMPRLLLAVAPLVGVAAAHLPAAAACGWIVAAVGTAVAGIADARTGRIFDPLSLTTASAGLMCAAWAGCLVPALAAGAAAGAGMWLLYAITAGRGLGRGDIKLAVALAVAVGTPVAAAVAVGAAFVAGGAYGAALVASGRAQRRDAVRFAPFLAGGTSAGLLASALGWL